MEITVRSVDNGWILTSWDAETEAEYNTVHLNADDLLWEIIERMEFPYDRFSNGKREKLVVAYVGEDVVL